MTGSGQPIERRVASSSSTIRIDAHAPRRSAADCRRGTRDRRRSTGCRAPTPRSRAPSAQSTSGMPPGAQPRVRPRVLVASRLRERKDQEDEAEHERQMDAAMRRLAQQAEAGRVVVEAATARPAARRRRASPAARAAGSASRDRISPRARGPSWRRVPARRLPPRVRSRSPRAFPRPHKQTGPARRPRRCDPSRVATRRPTSAALFLVELLGARMERDADPAVASVAWIGLPLAWPASSSLRVLSFHSALVIL